MAAKPTLLEQALIQLGHPQLAGQDEVELICVSCGRVHTMPVAPLAALPRCCSPKRHRRKAQP